jgi:UDP-N-acetylmuramyl tripeptide synthase
MMAYIYKYKYDLIDEKLKIFAVTGTDGKTSMVTILHILFSGLLGLSASIGTLGVNLNGIKYNFNQTTPTTPEIKDIYYMFKNLYEKDVRFIFMEATSIASVQKRLASISFDNLSFTTMTSDHLDFHKTLENYYDAKIAFIRQLANSKKSIKTLIYNLDDSNSNLIKKELKKLDNIISFNYGYDKDSDFRIVETKYINRLLNIKIEISKKVLSLYNLPEDKKIIEIDTNLIGKVNSYNIVHSIAQIFNYLIVHQKKDSKEFFSYIEKAKKIFLRLSIPGRMERIEYNNNDIFIDYAHTADSLQNAILTLKDAGYKKIITIMGCGGDRDRQKTSYGKNCH